MIFSREAISIVPRKKKLEERGRLEPVLGIQLILMQIRIRILDPRWKKKDPDPNPSWNQIPRLV